MLAVIPLAAFYREGLVPQGNVDASNLPGARTRGTGATPLSEQGYSSPSHTFSHRGRTRELLLLWLLLKDEYVHDRDTQGKFIQVSYSILLVLEIVL